MNISYETLKRIEAQLDRLEGRLAQERDYCFRSDVEHREAWLIAGFRPCQGDQWMHSDGRHVTYTLVITTMPDEYIAAQRSLG